MCDYVVKDNVKVYNGQDIASAFNKFNINVGPDLAKNINDPNKCVKFNDFVKDIDLKSKFDEPATEKEILNIVSSFNNKPSEDVHGISMAVVKSVIMNIVKPITFMANLSLGSGVFPDKL